MPALAEPVALPDLGALTHLLHALVGRPVKLQWLGAESLPDPCCTDPVETRAILRPDAVLLAPSHDRGRLLASVVHAAAHLRHSPPRQPVGKLKPIGLALASAIEDARVEWLMMRRYPGLKALLLARARLAVASPAGPEGSFPDLIARLHCALLDPAHPDPNHWITKARQGFYPLLDTPAELDRFRHLGSVLGHDLGQMRVRMNLQGYRVAFDHGDDNSYLWAFEQTSEHALASQVLPPSGAAPPARPGPAGAAEVAPQVSLHSYPEWDYRLKRERAHWTTVIEHRSVSAPSASDRLPPSVTRFRSRAHRLDPGKRLRRQSDGEDIDLDAATDWMLAQRLGLPLDPRVHRRVGHRPPCHSLLLLLDLSASSNDRIGDTAHSVLELSCQAARALVENGRRNGDRVAVHGFSSNTRHQIDYLRVHDFDDNDTTALALRLAALRARHSTRLGAALRHAIECLRSEASPNRHIVLISDGECADIDVFDRDYLHQDARRAVLLARRSGLTVSALGVGVQPDDRLRRLMGQSHCSTLTQAHTLARRLQQLYERLPSR